jgi:hypothetical protein
LCRAGYCAARGERSEDRGARGEKKGARTHISACFVMRSAQARASRWRSLVALSLATLLTRSCTSLLTSLEVRFEVFPTNVQASPPPCVALPCLALRCAWHTDLAARPPTRSWCFSPLPRPFGRSAKNLMRIDLRRLTEHRGRQCRAGQSSSLQTTYSVSAGVRVARTSSGANKSKSKCQVTVTEDE